MSARQSLMMCALALFVLVGIVPAQGTPPTDAQPVGSAPATTPAEEAPPPTDTDEDDAEPLPKELDKGLRKSEPDTFNELLSGLSDETSLGRFLKGINFRFKAFDDQDGENATLGFSYDFQKALTTAGDGSSSMSFNIYGRGNVAFDDDVNPEDFLETGFQLHLFGWRYDHANLDAVAERLNRPPAPGEVATGGNRFQEFLSLQAKQDSELREIFADPTWDELKRSIGDVLGDEFFWDVAAHASLESNQDFSSKQSAYGLQYGMVMRDWSPTSNRTKFNLFDYPFAAVRYLTGANEEFRASGLAWPSLLVGVDLVDPNENEARKAIDETDPYARVRAELGMKTKIAKLDDEHVWTSLGFRYYHEIDAPEAVEDAELDEQAFFAASLDFPEGWYVRYASGKLPVDEQNDDVFELGWAFSF